MRQDLKFLLLASAFVVTATGAWGTPLQARGPNMVYDPDKHITWVANANLGAGSSFDDGDSNSDGRMNYAAAVAWATNLNYMGFDDWRLPSAPVVDTSCSNQLPDHSYGYNCVGGELGYLFYVHFQLSAGAAASTSTSADYQLFQNIYDGPTYNYWYGSPWYEEFTRPGFHFVDGFTNYGVPLNQWYAWAVRDGDVSQVPEPSSLSLVGAAIALRMLARRRTRTDA